jgi:hypothetical protein
MVPVKVRRRASAGQPRAGRRTTKGGAMVLKIDDIDPNIFPAVHSTDVDLTSEQQIELVLITLIQGRAVRIKVRLDRVKAEILAAQLNEILGLF